MASKPDLIRGFRDVSIARSGMRTNDDGSCFWGASFRLDGDVRVLFPYINAICGDARYALRPHCIQFDHEGVRCTLYPKDAVAAPFDDRDHAYRFIEGLILFLNDLSHRRAELTPNHALARRTVSVLDILKSLPRSNCGACGYPTCMAFAAALNMAQAVPDDCPEFAQPLYASKIYPVIGADGTLAATFSIATPQRESAPGMHRRPSKTDPRPVQHPLTSREIQVLQLVAEGASNPEISAHLNISPHTVKSHIIHIFNKLGVNDRTQAAVWAAQNALV